MTTDSQSEALEKMSADAATLTTSSPELLVHGSDAAFREMVHAFFGFLARHESIRSGHGKFIGLAGIEYTTLISISHLGADGSPVSLNRLADHLHLSGAFVTNVTNRLVKQEIIVKEADPRDRRKVRLSVTHKGRVLLQQLAPVQRQVNDVQFETMKKADMLYITDMLKKLIQSSDQALKLQAYLQTQTKANAE